MPDFWSNHIFGPVMDQQLAAQSELNIAALLELVPKLKRILLIVFILLDFRFSVLEMFACHQRIWWADSL
jgi:hypothetical protein